MRYLRRVAALALCSGCLAGLANAGTDPTPPHLLFHVRLGAASAQPSSGRLLLFATDEKAAEAKALEESDGKSSEVDAVDADPFGGGQDAVAAREVGRWLPGQTIDVDTDQIAYPAGWSQLPPGDYLVQAVLDVDHSYNYRGRGAGDLVSAVVKVHLLATAIPTLSLDKVVPAEDPWAIPADMPAPIRDARLAAHAHATPLDFVSPALSAYWGWPVHMRGWVLTPPGYDAKGATRYPVVYCTHGFGGGEARDVIPLVRVDGAMSRHEMPPMIWVFLDQSGATGTHEFADSANNGPWGQALTTELIPALESQYRMDARANGRFLTGHSSGGWATLWLQTRYPTIFGGDWSTSPDPADFHDFNGIDLYAAHANVFHRADGSAYPLVRDHAKVLVSFEQFAQLERVLGDYGGQLASFEWVFSPRGRDGRPEPMFDRDTGAVDSSVVDYWRDHFDIAWRLRQQWPQIKPDLDGKIHVYVGTADTFYLDGAVHRLQAVLDGLHATSDFHFLPDRSHFDVYLVDQDRIGLLKQIAWQMYAIARPESTLRPPAASSQP